jgi:phage tail-like protein
MGVLNDLNPLAAAGLPLTSYHFRVDFGLPGLFVKDVGFQSVTGISMELALEEIKVGGPDKLFIPNGYNFEDLVLSRGMIKGSYLVNWLEAQILLQKKFPIPVIVTALDEMHFPIYSWVFMNAYPTKIKTNGFDASKSEVLIEEITMKYWFYKQVNMSYLSAALKVALKAAKALANSGPGKALLNSAPMKAASAVASTAKDVATNPDKVVADVTKGVEDVLSDDKSTDPPKK